MKNPQKSLDIAFKFLMIMIALNILFFIFSHIFPRKRIIQVTIEQSK